MQWLIDIAIEAMKQYLIDNPRYVDRGDPAAYDFTVGDFIKNSVWHPLDLSAIVPQNAKAVLFHLRIRNTSVGKIFAFRKHGNVNVHAWSSHTTQVANVSFDCDAVCAVDADRKLSYYATITGWTFINVTIRGWWL